MTREEAIKIFNTVLVFGKCDCTKDEIEECFKMAIEALEQQPCEDCISRQAAIDAIQRLNIPEDMCVFEIISHIDVAIVTLPPVQPQYTDAEIQKMQDLEFAEIQKVYEIGKDEGSSENPNKWIPVETALPEVGSEVLVCFDFKGKRSVYISHFFGDGKFHGLDDEYLTSEGRKYRKAVAWMPLPEPYKIESLEIKH